MKHEPPVSEANRSPYPLTEPPHVHAARPANLPALRDAEPRREVSKAAGGTVVRYGTAVAVAIGATVAALLFSRRKPAPAKPKPKAKAGKRKAKPGKASR